MQTYQAWNHALAVHFLQGVACGSRIYLSVDDAALEAIGRQNFEAAPLNESWREDLIAAVRHRIVRGDRLDLSTIDHQNNCVPLGVGLLSVCVLAAYDMATDVEISEQNYFQRLRTILNVVGNPIRPSGMPAGSEEPLWKSWNQWLVEQDYIPTAKRGQSTKTKFVNYPISQCLLRQADRDRLEKYFYEQKWTSSWDAQTLFSRLREKTQQFPEYLRKLIKDSNDRYEVLAEAVQEVHQEWLEAGCPAPGQSQRSRTLSPNLFAGLYRSEEDYEIEYYLYPKQKPQQKWENVEVNYQGQTEVLQIDRPGWYLPFFEKPLTSSDLNNGIRCKITHPEHLKILQLPARDFWILVLDPEEPEAGVYGTWRSPQLGESCLVLCKQILMKDLNLLRDERLVNWSQEIQPFGDSETQWLELHNFQVLSQTWQGIFIENWELKDALQPKVKLSISLSGGLRSPNHKAWLQGHPPRVTVFGFMPTVKLEVLQLPDEQCVQQNNAVSTSKPQTLNLNTIGSYLIRATHGSNVAELFLRIESFETLKLCSPQNLEQHLQQTELPNTHKLCGAILYH